MFFILSKTLYYLILPVTIVFLLLLAALAVNKKKVKQRLLIITFLLFYLFTNDFVGNSLLRWWELDPVPFAQMEKTYDYGIVLTGVLQNQQKPYDRPFFDKGADRVFHTFQLYKKGIIDKIIISGGSGRLVNVGYKEAENLSDVFALMGVPKEDIIIETASRNTAESAKNVKEMVDPNHGLLLITSAFHMRRSRDSFIKNEIEVDIFPVDYYTDEELTIDSYIIPSYTGLNKWTRFIHEVTGYITYDIVGYI